MINCRKCKAPVSENAPTCPHCGAPQPYKSVWHGYGFYYQSRLAICGGNLLHQPIRHWFALTLTDHCSLSGYRPDRICYRPQHRVNHSTPSLVIKPLL
ncbi:MAG: hypothetical protein ACP5R6_05570 [Chlorobaculum sp.]